MPTIEISPEALISPDLEIRGNGRIVIGPFASIERGVVLNTGNGETGLIHIGSRSKIKAGCLLHGYGNNIRIGHRVSIGEYSIVAAHGGVFIGDNCIFGPYILVNAASHILDGDEAFRFLGESALGIHIDQNVWLGARVTILDGVTISKSSVIAAHSLIREDIPPRTLSMGSPSKVVRTLTNELYENDDFD
ncbi:MAG: acyltransferase [Rhodobacteraceae bacterium]|nr:acyltransferase [Paracoccaceae bacterium]